ncbi:MAG: PilZ domain-containing protein [Acidobacteriia bacterium]|nr:PilZ domain-containing protein [Terriglobia bacterium]
MDKIGGDRRNSRRYDIRLPVHYRVSQKWVMARSGSATTCEISTSGLSFRSRKPLPVGSHIEMIIDWPARYGDVYPIDLQATGFVVRSEHGRTAVRVTSRKFRVITMPAQALRVSA